MQDFDRNEAYKTKKQEYLSDFLSLGYVWPNFNLYHWFADFAWEENFQGTLKEEFFKEYNVHTDEAWDKLFPLPKAWEYTSDRIPLKTWSGIDTADWGPGYVLPIFPLVEEKKNGTAIASVQMLLAYRQEYFSTEELAEKLGYQENKGVDFEKIAPVLNQALWAYEKPKNATLAGYRVERLGKDDDKNHELFKTRVAENLDAGYPLIAEIFGKANIDVDKPSNFSRSVLIVGCAYDQHARPRGVFYIEPHINFQKAYWGGLHYLSVEQFLDAVKQSESQAYIW